MQLFGRTEILSPVAQITRDNIAEVLRNSMAIHAKNSREIDYLYNYRKGLQPVLGRVKEVRPNINNKVVENHASAIASYIAGYSFGEPVSYVRYGDRTAASAGIDRLNEIMYGCDKATHDAEMANWMATCGVAYRMVLPVWDEASDLPIMIDTPDPRSTFVVYQAGFGKRPLMAVRQYLREIDGAFVVVACCYTDTHYAEVETRSYAILKWEPHGLGQLPIIEYRLNTMLMGAFEPAVPLLDAINLLASNRMDGVENFVQSLMKFVNCDIDAERLQELLKLGAVKVKSSEGLPADVQFMTQELNQQQTQTFVDYLYAQVLNICGMPTTTKGGASTSDTGNAVYLRDGHAATYTRARDTEQLFKRSERHFIKLVLDLLGDTVDLKVLEVDCKFTRHQNDNLLTKTQSLLHMLEAGLNPEVAIATCALFNDPMDVTMRSQPFLRKWDYIDMTEEPDEPVRTV